MARSRGAVRERKSLLSRVLSIKGVAVTSVAGYLIVMQRELLVAFLGLLLKYPWLLLSWAGRTLLNLLIKPILLRLISLKGGGGGSDVLPGGNY
ncbi:MAG: hypothetical protein SGPRY_006394 [Prymnesium sp.]